MLKMAVKLTLTFGSHIITYSTYLTLYFFKKLSQGSQDRKPSHKKVNLITYQILFTFDDSEAFPCLLKLFLYRLNSNSNLQMSIFSKMFSK